MDLQDVIKLLELNEFSEIVKMKIFLLKIAENILNFPDNLSFRTIKKSNKIVSKNILSKKGGHEMFLLMGFKEHDTHYIFPSGQLFMDKLRSVKQDFDNWQPIHKVPVDTCSKVVAGPSSSKTISPERSPDFIVRKRIKLPTLKHKFANQFLKKITESFHEALVYANEDLKKNARSKIPVANLQLNAMRKMRQMQVESRKGIPTDPPVSIQMLLLVELLQWFNEQFFSWVDTPNCDSCNSETVFSHASSCDEAKFYARRLEVYLCNSCGDFTMFPRHDDLNILLETRKGRCGEWANTFTLMCHAMGWEARLVKDETDHVWTEVYCTLQKRWIHCDPCDRACDTPLMYEHGWKKSLTYIMAYSPYEIQDVTWRYSSNHKELLKRRKECSETELVEAIIQLRNDRLKIFSKCRQKHLLKRTLLELVELMIERKPKDHENVSRISGGLDWRIARGETVDDKSKHLEFVLLDTQLDILWHKIRYSCSLDRYESEGSGGLTIENWFSGTLNQDNIMRKVENDWKQVYLCRKDGKRTGYISWKIILKDTKKRIASVSLKMLSKTFENGMVSVVISDGKHSMNLPEDNILNTTDFENAESLLIEAFLVGGTGDLAWQHAQLFRQPVDSPDYPFELMMTFK